MSKKLTLTVSLYWKVHIKKLNKLILAMSKKFTLAVPSHFCFAPSSAITHSHFCEGLHMLLPYW